MLLLSFLAILSFASTTPIEDEVVKRTNPSARFCSTVRNQHCKPSATAYCSSYLSIPLKTATVTTTVAGAYATPRHIKLSAELATNAPRSTSTQTVTADPVYEQATITISSCAPRNSNAKAKRTMKKPACLSRYTYSKQISSACSCLSITPSTITTTSTVHGADSTQTTTITSTSTNTQYTIAPSATQLFQLQTYQNDATKYIAVEGPYPQFTADQSNAKTWKFSSDGTYLIAASGVAGGLYASGQGTTDPLPRVFMDGLGPNALKVQSLVYDGTGCYLVTAFGVRDADLMCASGYWNKGITYDPAPDGCVGFRNYVVTV